MSSGAPSFMDARSLALMIRVHRVLEQDAGSSPEERAKARSERETLEVMLAAKMNPPAPKRRRKPLEART